MTSIFSKIVAGEIPSYKVLEDEFHLAFLDVFPLKRGHVLVIPKKEVDYIFDLPDEELAALMNFAKKVAEKIKTVFPCPKVGMAVIGLEVPHAHIHLIPLDKVADINFEQPKLQLDSAALAQIAERIAKA